MTPTTETEIQPTTAPVTATSADLTPPPDPPLVTTAIADGPGETIWFKKVQVNMPFFAGGERVQFEQLDTNIGVLCIPPWGSAIVREALLRAAKDRRGGVVVITEALYQDLKKKLPLTQSAPKRRPMLQIWDRNARFNKNKPASKNPASLAEGDAGQRASTSPGPVGSGVVVGGGGAPAGPGAPLNPATRKLSKWPVMRKPEIAKLRGDSIVIPNPPPL